MLSAVIGTGKAKLKPASGAAAVDRRGRGNPRLRLRNLRPA
jgi:hypothetical protein